MSDPNVTIVFDKEDHKLQPESYSQTYRQMLLALIDELKPRLIHESCSAKDIDEGVVLFYDPHSMHHIEIEGLAQHKSISYEYYNDPFQPGLIGEYNDGTRFRKLGRGSRTKRSKERGIDYIICPYRDAYYKFLAPYIPDPDKRLVWFPVAPAKPKIVVPPLNTRMPVVLANGHTATIKGFGHYNFRKWSFGQPEVFYKQGCVHSDTPGGQDYIPFLSSFAGALALCDAFPVPKYFEIPLAGCVCFAQFHKEYYDLGFRHYQNCVFVEKNRFGDYLEDMKKAPEKYQGIADAGRKLVENRYTADKFACYIRRHIEQHLGDVR